MMRGIGTALQTLALIWGAFSICALLVFGCLSEATIVSKEGKPTDGLGRSLYETSTIERLMSRTPFDISGPGLTVSGWWRVAETVIPIAAIGLALALWGAGNWVKSKASESVPQPGPGETNSLSQNLHMHRQYEIGSIYRRGADKREYRYLGGDPALPESWQLMA